VAHLNNTYCKCYFTRTIPFGRDREVEGGKVGRKWHGRGLETLNLPAKMAWCRGARTPKGAGGLGPTLYLSTAPGRAKEPFSCGR
jgi:hypothetical protein